MRFILFILYEYLKHSKHTFHYLYTKSMYVQIIIEKIQSTFNININKERIKHQSLFMNQKPKVRIKI